MSEASLPSAFANTYSAMHIESVIDETFSSQTGNF